MKINEVTEYNLDGELATVSVDSPPVNAISAVVRKGLLAAFKKAASDPSVKGIILICKGKTFFSGADITEFDKGPASPTLQELQNQIESATKPVVSAIHGTALGGGLELALVTHYRVAVLSAKFGFPEVKLGLTPGAGGTQRLPRLIGVENSLEMLTSGEFVSAKTARDMGLIDHVAEDGCLEKEAAKFLNAIVIEGSKLRRVRDIGDNLGSSSKNKDIVDKFKNKNQKKFRGYMAPDYIIQCVRSAIEKPFDDGLRFERQCFEELKKSTQSKAQRYVFFAERKAGKVPDIPKDTPITEIEKIGVVGAGRMGRGIAISFLNAGRAVTLVDAKQDSLKAGIDGINKYYLNSVKKGRLSEGKAEKCMAQLKGSMQLEDVADCDLIVEAVFEDLDIKQKVFRQLDVLAKPEALFATNTSYLDVEKISSVTRRPEHIVGMHFFSPAHIMRLLEIVRCPKTSKTAIATALKLAKDIGKVGVVVGNCQGFVGNRMLAKRQNQAEKLVVEGATPWDVDRVLYEFGFPMGPFAMRDLAGLDIGWNRHTSKSSTIRDILNEMGRQGQKVGAGYYDYDSDGNRTPSSVVDEIISKFRRDQGIEKRRIDDTEILNRCLYAMVNEGANILQEGKALRASDVDIVWVTGYGWPSYRGGPMYWGEEVVGLNSILDELRELEKRHGNDFKPSPLIEKLAGEKRSFFEA